MLSQNDETKLTLVQCNLVNKIKQVKKKNIFQETQNQTQMYEKPLTKIATKQSRFLKCNQICFDDSLEEYWRAFENTQAY